MKVLGDFRLKTLLERIADELRQPSKESRYTPKNEYKLEKPLGEQQEFPSRNCKRRDG
ncbi:MAG: hypothetical protein M0Z55_06390 [Peptococcaceae bacterium]|nr:hypothetical protein [Peptococcaceae bacterium]